MRLVIYPDTNAFYSDRFFRKPYSAEFLSLLEMGVVELRLSPVVVAETLRHARDDAAERTGHLKRGLRAATVGSSVDATGLREAIEEISGRLRVGAEDALQPLRSHPAVAELSFPTVSAEELVVRELDRRRPTLSKGPGAIGFRDAVIWFNILEDIDPGADDLAMIITGDSGLLDASGRHLHEHLVEDLDEYGIDDSRVRVQPDLARASVEIKRLRKLISERDARLSEALLQFVGWLPEARWGGHHASDGTFDQYDDDLPALPSYLAEPTVTAVDYLVTDSIGGGNPATCVAHASVDIDGHMLTSDFVADANDEVELSSGEVDDWYVEVSVTRQVRIEVSIELDLEHGWTDVVSYNLDWL